VAISLTNFAAAIDPASLLAAGVTSGEAAGLLEDLADIRSIGDSLLANLFDVVTAKLASIIDADSPILTVGENHASRAFRAKL
jgi:hypothetical protein